MDLSLSKYAELSFIVLILHVTLSGSEGSLPRYKRLSPALAPGASVGRNERSLRVTSCF